MREQWRFGIAAAVTAGVAVLLATLRALEHTPAGYDSQTPDWSQWPAWGLLGGFALLALCCLVRLAPWQAILVGACGGALAVSTLGIMGLVVAVCLLGGAGFAAVSLRRGVLVGAGLGVVFLAAIAASDVARNGLGQAGFSAEWGGLKAAGGILALLLAVAAVVAACAGVAFVGARLATRRTLP